MAKKSKEPRIVRPDDVDPHYRWNRALPALERLAERADIVVLDCLTLWVSNLMQLYDQDEPILTATDQLAKTLKSSKFATVVVTDEVGWGIVPEHPMARRYRDLLGWTNQKIASVADDVLLMVSGYPVKVK